MGRARAILLLVSLVASVTGDALISSRLAYADATGPTAGNTADVAAARRLFTEALAEEEKADYASALAKFKAVQGVRDTAAVRFRVGACLEGLGRLKEAKAAYTKAVEAAGADPAQSDLVSEARAKVVEIDRRLPQLTIALSREAPADAAVWIDDEAIERAALARPIAIDPGEHRVVGRAAEVSPYETHVQLPEGARMSIKVPLDPSRVDAPLPGGPLPSRGSSSSSSNSTLGWALVGGGAALLVVGGVTLAVRETAITKIHDACPDDRCPESARGDVSSERTRANTMLPITIATGLIGAVATGTGIVVLATSGGSKSIRNRGAMLRARVAPIFTGSGVSLDGTF